MEDAIAAETFTLPQLAVLEFELDGVGAEVSRSCDA
jgi:hypothetical protein